MPTDGTLVLEYMPKSKQYLVTALSVFFSLGAVFSAIVALLLIPSSSCPALPAPCTPAENSGWQHMFSALGLAVRHSPRSSFFDADNSDLFIRRS
jgi:MFS family permease